MNLNIHKTALVSDNVELGENIQIGPFSIIEDNAKIGDNCNIGAHVQISSGVILAEDCKVFNGAILGTIPQDLKFEGEQSALEIGSGTVIREYCTLNRGTSGGGGVTSVGSNCLLMAYAHVAHDCHIGDNVILANGVTMAGHVTIANDVGVSGLVLIHQFTHIGQYAYIGGGSRIPMDVPPFILANGAPLRYYGPNSVGLKRKGFTTEVITNIKRAYNYIYRSPMNIKQALETIKSEMEQTSEIKEIVEFIESSERGIFKG
ncbi:acyl-ACP--UDP-N-acetylglucosamine O-acyltransferase [bacterium]|nr:acyl-ACP--UDP-N-acetylglucosamine O-acyltransferase [bacterium]